MAKEDIRANLETYIIIDDSNTDEVADGCPNMKNAEDLCEEMSEEDFSAYDDTDLSVTFGIYKLVKIIRRTRKITNEKITVP